MPRKEALAEAADRALYAAKRAGRNCVEFTRVELESVEGVVAAPVDLAGRRD